MVASAYERNSLIVTTSLPFENWTEVLGSECLTGAALDWLADRCHPGDQRPKLPTPGRQTPAAANREIHPSEESALKNVYMAIREASRKWTLPIKHWQQLLNRFTILFEDRMPQPIHT